MSDDEKLIQTESIIREGLRQRWARACGALLDEVTEALAHSPVHRAYYFRRVKSFAAAAREASAQCSPQRVREMALLVLEAERAEDP